MEESMLSLPPVLAGEGLPLFFAFSMQCTRAWYGMSDPIMFPRTTLFMSTMSMSMSAMPMSTMSMSTVSMGGRSYVV